MATPPLAVKLPPLTLSTELPIVPLLARKVPRAPTVRLVLLMVPPVRERVPPLTFRFVPLMEPPPSVTLPLLMVKVLTLLPEERMLRAPLPFLIKAPLPLTATPLAIQMLFWPSSWSVRVPPLPVPVRIFWATPERLALLVTPARVRLKLFMSRVEGWLAAACGKPRTAALVMALLAPNRRVPYLMLKREKMLVVL